MKQWVNMSESGGRSAGHQIEARPVQRQLYARFWQSAAGFWRGRRGRMAWLVTALLIVIVLVQLLVQYQLNLWNRDFFNALERKDGAALWSETRLFLPLAASSILLAALSVWGRMRVQRKWRELLTVHITSLWLLDCRYSRLDYEATGNKNPEYQITDDVRVATDAPIDLALGFLSFLLTGTIFIGVLWRVGGGISITLFGLRMLVPGYLVVGVLAYSSAVTATMMIVGRSLYCPRRCTNSRQYLLPALSRVVAHSFCHSGDGRNDYRQPVDHHRGIFDDAPVDPAGLAAASVDHPDLREGLWADLCRCHQLAAHGSHGRPDAFLRQVRQSGRRLRNRCFGDHAHDLGAFIHRHARGLGLGPGGKRSM